MIFQSFISPPFTVKTTYLEKLKPVQEIRVSGTYPNTPLVQFDKTPLKKKKISFVDDATGRFFYVKDQ